MKEISKGSTVRNKVTGFNRKIVSIKGAKYHWVSGKNKGNCNLETLKRWISGVDF